ncbi:kynureninase [Acinetobacter bereziniae]|uniref:kynureninase n=1 Tax=Acinetobacter bereziniae TaxID=106648 RepID=UPI001D0E3168|nr:kynureninase [Acinetobacter bereziniae]
MKKALLFIIMLSLLGCSKPNSKPTYGDSGLPKNCRAIIQTNIDEYRKIRSSNEDIAQQLENINGVFDSLERNCGSNGYSWENN